MEAWDKITSAANVYVTLPNTVPEKLTDILQCLLLIYVLHSHYQMKISFLMSDVQKNEMIIYISIKTVCTTDLNIDVILVFKPQKDYICCRYNYIITELQNINVYFGLLAAYWQLLNTCPVTSHAHLSPVLHQNRHTLRIYTPPSPCRLKE